jgi:hypothetical protein
MRNAKPPRHAMRNGFATIKTFSLLIVLAAAPAAHAYILRPPMTLKIMYERSHLIQVLSVEKFSKENGVIIFRLSETLKTRETGTTSRKHVFRTDHPSWKLVLEWAGEGKPAVLFFVEGKPRTAAFGYVFIDKFCYSVSYDYQQKHWLFVRGEPDLSACYYGSAEQLVKLIKDSMEGKTIQVPVKEPATKEDTDKRWKEIDPILNKKK